MIDLVGGLIWIVIILAFVVPWIRGTIQRIEPPRNVRPPASGPRGFAESGGMQAQPAQSRPVDQSLVRGPGRRDEPRAERPQRESAPAQPGRPQERATTTSARADRIRRQLSNKETVRSAVVLREVLDPPVSMR